MTLFRSAVACLFALAGPAFADSASAQQSDTSAGQPRVALSDPDRPDVTNGTHIVDTGLLQIEFGGLFTRTGSAQNAVGTPFTARLGVAEWLEVRAGTDGLVSQSDGTLRASGYGNTQLGAKLRLWADPGGVPVLSILPTVNLPTADAGKGLGSGKADFSVAILTGSDFGRHVHADVNYGVASIGDGDADAHFAQHLVSVSVSDAISDNWNPYIEAFWFSRLSLAGASAASIDAGAIYQIGERYAVDGGVQMGVTRDAPGFALFGGISVLVGDVLGSRGAVARQRAAEHRLRSRGGHK